MGWLFWFIAVRPGLPFFRARIFFFVASVVLTSWVSEVLWSSSSRLFFGFIARVEVAVQGLLGFELAYLWFSCPQYQVRGFFADVCKRSDSRWVLLCGWWLV